MRVPGFRFVQAAGNYADKDGLHYGIAVHATANTASDENETAYSARRTDGTSAHAYTDRDSLIQALDTDRKAGHAGSSTGNENSLAIEFVGLNSWSRATWLANIAWAEVGRWVAYILKNDPDYRGFQVRRASVSEMQSNPRVKAFYGHDDMRRAWGGTTHTDPGPNFPWDRLFQAVNSAMGTATPTARKDEDMAVIAQGADGQLYFCIGGFSHEIEAGNVGDIRYVAEQGAYSLAHGPGNDAEWTWEGWVRLGWSAAVFGPVWKSTTPGEPSAVDLDALAGKVAGALGALRFEAA